MSITRDVRRLRTPDGRAGDEVEVLGCTRCGMHLIVVQSTVDKGIVDAATGWMVCGACGERAEDGDICCVTPMQLVRKRNLKGQIVAVPRIAGPRQHICSMCQRERPMMVEVD